MKTKFLVVLVSLFSVSTVRAESTVGGELSLLAKGVTDEVKNSVIGNTELAQAQRDLLTLKGQLLVAQAGRSLPIVAGVLTSTTTILSTLGSSVGSKVIGTGVGVLNDGIGSRVARFGQKYSKFVLITGLATTASMVHWYLLADDQVDRFLAEVNAAEETVSRLIAAREILASEPTP